MAQRRMFSLKIINSARFLKMPVDTQALYFHLGLHTDDDGVVEAYPILRATGSSEDNLRVLVAKGFVKILNEDLVSFITDWKEHNLIRADRKVDSIYKNLLLEILPNVDLIEPKPRADTKKIPRQRQKTEVDDHWTPTGQHRLGKVRLGKVSIVKDNIIISSSTKKITDDFYQLIKTNNPHIKRTPNEKDYQTISMLLKKYPEDIVSGVMMFSQADQFWQSNVLSASGLKKHFEKLYAKAKSRQGGKVVRI